MKEIRIGTATAALAFPLRRSRVCPYVHVGAGLVAGPQTYPCSLSDGIGLEGKAAKLSRTFGELGVNHDCVVRGETQLRAAVGARFGG
jgi:hypothetical protein